ncbi:unnamed protein product [Linum trigynum]|uniref:Uncharacterized protein n=1 Tax=Linum trigynum TaxID=586398 RepID=A0AAV2ES61_9ROSI
MNSVHIPMEEGGTNSLKFKMQLDEKLHKTSTTTILDHSSCIQLIHQRGNQHILFNSKIHIIFDNMNKCRKIPERIRQAHSQAQTVTKVVL